MLRIKVSFLDPMTAREQIARITGKEVLVEDSRFLNVLTIVLGDSGDIEKLEEQGFEIEVWKDDE